MPQKKYALVISAVLLICSFFWIDRYVWKSEVHAVEGEYTPLQLELDYLEQLKSYQKLNETMKEKALDLSANQSTNEKALDLSANQTMIASELVAQNHKRAFRFCVAVHFYKTMIIPEWMESDEQYVFMSFGRRCPHCVVDHHIMGKSAFHRTFKMLSILSQTYDCDYVVKVDDDTAFYKNIPANLTGDYLGGRFMQYRIRGAEYFSGGAGYLIKGALIPRLLDECQFGHVFEDTGVGICMRNLKVKPTILKGMYDCSPEHMLFYQDRLHMEVDPISFHHVKDNRKSNGVIPKKYHVISLNGEVPMDAMNSCKAINPDWEFFIWTTSNLTNYKFEDKEQPGFYSNHLCSKIESDHNRSVCIRNLWRLEILYLQGGVVVDANTTCKSSLNTLNLKGVDLFAINDSSSIGISNHAIGASKYNADIYETLKRTRFLNMTQVTENVSSFTGACMLLVNVFGRYSPFCKNANNMGFSGAKSVFPKCFDI